jgi:hypothetical protein
MSDSVVDEVIATRSGSGALPRAQIEETIGPNGGKARVKMRPDVQEESVVEGGSRKSMKKSVSDLLDQIGNVPESDMGVEMPGEETTVHEDADQNEGIEAAGEEEAPADGEETTEEEAAPKVDVWQEKATKLEATNRALARELEAPRPSRPRSARRARKR